jgi:CelD/BcsL family acetyltransferase involved in cellulose biosynthesis
LQAWLDIYGSSFEGHWLRWHDGEQPVGGCLLLKRTVWWQVVPQPTVFLNVAAETLPLSPWSEYNQALYLAGYEEATAQALARAASQLRWARLELWGYEENAFSRSFLGQLPCGSVQTRSEHAPFVDLTALGSQSYEASLSSKTRSQIRRSRRMYEEAHGPVFVEFASTAEEALAFLDQLGILHNAIWRSRGEEPSFEKKEFREFHQEVVKRLWPVAAVDLLRVRAKDRIIGYLFNFRRHGKVYCYQSGFAQEADKNLKPGLLTHASAISEYARQGMLEYDLLSGDSRYKRSLTKEYRTLFWSTAYRSSLYGRALWSARQIKARVRHAERETPAESVGDA